MAEDRRDCYWLYVVTDCAMDPRLQEPIKDPARFPWHEVKKVDHYYIYRGAGEGDAGAGDPEVLWRTAVTGPDSSIVPVERIENAILFIRGHKVMLDADLARLYGVSVKRLNEAVKRNRDRFPEDFVFQLTGDEAERVRRHFAAAILRSQIATSSWGGRRYLPYAFTEQGVAMLSSVLRSMRAVQVNIGIMRAFVRLRRMLASNEDLARKLAALEKKYDAQFKVVFDAIRELMAPPRRRRRRIGFLVSEKAGRYGRLPASPGTR